MHRLVKFGTLTSALLVAAGMAMPAAAQQSLRLGTSSIGSTFYVIAVGMSKLIQEHAGFNTTVEPLGGSHANIFGLDTKKVDLAVANSGATYDGYFGNKPFKNKMNVRIVLQGQPTYRGLFIRKGSGIKSARDLVGKVFLAKRRPLPELEKLANAYIAVHHLPKNKIKMVSSVNLGEMNRSLRAGSVDMVSYPFGLRQPVMTKLFNDDIVEPVIMSEKEYDAVMKRLPDMFYKAKIKANHFKNQPKAFLTFGLTTQLAASAATSEETVYKVVKAILGNLKEFSKIHGSARQWNAKRTISDPKIPFHPGTVRYLKEVGMWNAKLEATQKRLLSRM